MSNVKIELTKDEHTMVTAILMMHHIGMVVSIHPDKRPMLDDLAQRFSLENMRLMIKD